jgi:hypothetical protein
LSHPAYFWLIILNTLDQQPKKFFNNGGDFLKSSKPLGRKACALPLFPHLLSAIIHSVINCIIKKDEPGKKLTPRITHFFHPYLK